MIELQCRFTSRKRVYIPDVTAFDKDSGEPQDIVAANLTVLFAIVPAGDPDPAETTYRAGAWVQGKPTATATIMLGPGGTIDYPDRGYFDLWMAVNGVQEAPRDVVARLVVP